MAAYAAAPPPPPGPGGPPDASSSPPAAGSGSASGPQPPVQHKRVYQACIPCRRRKVRCDLGSVDDPHDPPCVRCRRESKECYFSATRRKRRTEDEGFGDSAGTGPEDEYIVRNGRKRAHAGSGSPPPPPPSVDRRVYSEVPLTPGGSVGRTQPLRRPGDHPHHHHHHHSGRSDSRSTTTAPAASGRRSTTGDFGGAADDEPNTPLENFEARTVMRRGVFGPHDALDLLYKAATDDSKHDTGPAAPSASAAGAAGARAGLVSDGPYRGDHRDYHHLHRPGAMPSQGRAASHGGRSESDGRVSSYARQGGQHVDAPVDPGLSRGDATADPGYAEALRAWARFRFVRAGWFTAQEAIGYIDYYYDYLSPLTPISPPTFRNPASHVTLLLEEPILTVTLLTISSRYRTLPGTGGHCRSHAIHEQLWTYLRGMIERVIWGQEAFGGGFCGSGAFDELQSSSTAPWRGLRKGSLRTLGTIESLMILTEWHPRALHFPPADATDELMLPSTDPRDHIADDGAQRPSAGVGGKRIESWLEPAWRSDRMCWMLLSTAMGLAYELGVFDDIDELLAAGAIPRPEYEDEGYRLRAFRIKRLLLIYLSQLAGRLGWTNMVPESLRRSDPAVSRRRPATAATAATAAAPAAALADGATPATNPSSLSHAFDYVPDLELDDQIIHCWAGISNVMQIGNVRLFQSRKHTTDIIQTGRYTALLADFQPMLREWWREFERFRLPPFIRHILTIEYEYVRIYVNSLSLQAVVERCTSNAAGTSAGAGAAAPTAAAAAASSAGPGAAATAAGSGLSPQTQNYYGKLPLGQLGGFSAADQECVREVVEGSRSLLRAVVEGLLPYDYLKHAPVRTYFRIISGAMFLLKTFALGATRSDVELSIGLLDRTVDALRHCVVDDVHLGKRFADLLENLTSRLRNRFIHAPAPSMQAASAEPRSPSAAAAAADEAVNGNGNGNGHGHHPAINGHEAAWAKLRDGGGHQERSSTPANISATPFDLTAGTFPQLFGASSLFGPSTPAADGQQAGAGGPHGGGGGGPSSGALPEGGGVFGGGDAAADWSAGNPGDEMWYLPPGPAFFQNMGDSAVSMTAEGVNVGGMDLLEYMAMDQFPLDGVGGY